MIQDTNKKHSSLEKNVREIEGDIVENVIRVTDKLNKVASEGVDAFSDNMSAIVESGNVASHIFQETRSEIMENYNRNISIYTEIAREAMRCRTISHMIELQNNAVQQLCENYFTTTNQLSKIIFDLCADAINPISNRANKASNKIRKVMID